MIRKKISVLCAVLSIMGGLSFVHAAPEISFSPQVELSPGKTVNIPILLSNVSGYEIGGYALRIDYDDTVLSNPEVADAGTLSEGNPNLRSKVPSDGIGKLAVGIGFDFSAQDGTLIILRFAVSENFCDKNTKLSFAGKNRKSVLFSAAFDKIESVFADAAFSSPACVTDPPAVNPTPLNPGTVDPGKQPDITFSKQKYCVPVDSSLQAELCGQYIGNAYNFALVYYINPADPSGIYWRMRPESFSVPDGNPENSIGLGDDLSLNACFHFSDRDYYLHLEHDPAADCPESLCWKTETVTQNCFQLDEDLSLDICAEYRGISYDVTMDYAPSISDPHWKINPDTLKAAGRERECVPLTDDLSLHLCAEFQEKRYFFTLDYAPDEKEADGVYWKMDTQTLIQVD